MILCIHELSFIKNKYSLDLNVFQKLTKNFPKAELHFDDGRRGILMLEKPYLQNIASRSTLFLVPNFIKGLVPKHENWSNFLNIKEIRKLVKLGFSIGSHSLAHHNLTNMDNEEILKDLRRSREWLEAYFKVEVIKFAYPYGAVNERIASIAESIYKKCYSLNSPLGITRTLVERQIQ